VALEAVFGEQRADFALEVDGRGSQGEGSGVS
jgi:hypothetical protein